MLLVRHSFRALCSSTEQNRKKPQSEVGWERSTSQGGVSASPGLSSAAVVSFPRDRKGVVSSRRANRVIVNTSELSQVCDHVSRPCRGEYPPTACVVRNCGYRGHSKGQCDPVMVANVSGKVQEAENEAAKGLTKSFV